MMKTNKKTTKTPKQKVTNQPEENVVQETIDSSNELSLVDSFKDLEVKSPKKRRKEDEPLLDIKAVIEGALYVAGKEGMSLSELHKILPKVSSEDIKRHLFLLQNKLDNDAESGITVKDFGNKYKLLTKIEIKNEMRRFSHVKLKNPLNSKLMEVLAIIAYNQPCTRPRISEIRGIDSAPLVDMLIERGLVVELGRADTWGRPFIYSVTDKFFDLFGIKKIEDLPEVQKFDLDSFQETSFFDSNRYEE